MVALEAGEWYHHDAGGAHEVVDEALIPRDYLMPDEVKIGKVVRATAGSLQIPGIRVFSYKSQRANKI